MDTRALRLFWLAGAFAVVVSAAEPAASQTGTVAGTVLKCNGTAALAAQVHIEGSDLGALTTNGGAFLLFNVPAGTYALGVALIGYSSVQIPITVASGATTDLGRFVLGCDVVELGRPGWVNGSVPAIQSVLVVDADAGSGGCLTDRVMGDGDFAKALFPFVQNLVPASSCSSEVAAFSVGYAPYFQNSPSAWTTAQGDVLADVFGPRLPTPLRFWVAAPSADTTLVMSMTLEHYLKAEQVFHQNRVGLALDRVASTATAGMTTIADNCEAAIANGLQTSPWYQAGTLNVYYVDQAYSMSGSVLIEALGVSCTADNNIIFVSYETADPSTLSHEIGHAFGLRLSRGHTNWTLTIPFGDPACTADEDPGRADCQPPCLLDWDNDMQPSLLGCQKFTPSNIMDPYGVTRSHFTVGQVYQMVFLGSSRLNVNGHRSGPTKASCGIKPWDDADCPRLWIDP